MSDDLSDEIRPKAWVQRLGSWSGHPSFDAVRRRRLLLLAFLPVLLLLGLLAGIALFFPGGPWFWFKVISSPVTLLSLVGVLAFLFTSLIGGLYADLLAVDQSGSAENAAPVGRPGKILLLLLLVSALPFGCTLVLVDLHPKLALLTALLWLAPLLILHLILFLRDGQRRSSLWRVIGRTFKLIALGGIVTTASLIALDKAGDFGREFFQFLGQWFPSLLDAVRRALFVLILIPLSAAFYGLGVVVRELMGRSGREIPSADEAPMEVLGDPFEDKLERVASDLDKVLKEMDPTVEVSALERIVPSDHAEEGSNSAHDAFFAFKPNADQINALEAINAAYLKSIQSDDQAFSDYILHGPESSGRTSTLIAAALEGAIIHGRMALIICGSRRRCETALRVLQKLPRGVDGRDGQLALFRSRQLTREGIDDLLSGDLPDILVATLEDLEEFLYSGEQVKPCRLLLLSRELVLVDELHYERPEAVFFLRAFLDKHRFLLNQHDRACQVVLAVQTLSKVGKRIFYDRFFQDIREPRYLRLRRIHDLPFFRQIIRTSRPLSPQLRSTLFRTFKQAGIGVHAYRPYQAGEDEEAGVLYFSDPEELELPEQAPCAVVFVESGRPHLETSLSVRAAGKPVLVVRLADPLTRAEYPKVSSGCIPFYPNRKMMDLLSASQWVSVVHLFESHVRPVSIHWLRRLGLSESFLRPVSTGDVDTARFSPRGDFVLDLGNTPALSGLEKADGFAWMVEQPLHYSRQEQTVFHLEPMQVRSDAHGRVLVLDVEEQALLMESAFRWDESVGEVGIHLHNLSLFGDWCIVSKEMLLVPELSELNPRGPRPLQASMKPPADYAQAPIIPLHTLSVDFQQWEEAPKILFDPGKQEILLAEMAAGKECEVRARIERLLSADLLHQRKIPSLEFGYRARISVLALGGSRLKTRDQAEENSEIASVQGRLTRVFQTGEPGDGGDFLNGVSAAVCASIESLMPGWLPYVRPLAFRAKEDGVTVLFLEPDFAGTDFGDALVKILEDTESRDEFFANILWYLRRLTDESSMGNSVCHTSRIDFDAVPSSGERMLGIQAFEDAWRSFPRTDGTYPWEDIEAEARRYLEKLESAPDDVAFGDPVGWSNLLKRLDDAYAKSDLSRKTNNGLDTVIYVRGNARLLRAYLSELPEGIGEPVGGRGLVALPIDSEGMTDPQRRAIVRWLKTAGREALRASAAIGESSEGVELEIGLWVCPEGAWRRRDVLSVEDPYHDAYRGMLHLRGLCLPVPQGLRPFEIEPSTPKPEPEPFWTTVPTEPEAEGKLEILRESEPFTFPIITEKGESGTTHGWSFAGKDFSLQLNDHRHVDAGRYLQLLADFTYRNSHDHHYFEYVENDPLADAIRQLSLRLQELFRQAFSSGAENGSHRLSVDYASYLLAFIQAFKYKPDPHLERSDLPRYASEFFANGGGDCEDSAIAYSALLSDAGFEHVFLSFPGHAAIGVAGAFRGLKVPHKGVDYYYAETAVSGGYLEIGSETKSSRKSISVSQMPPLKALASRRLSILCFDYSEAMSLIHLEKPIESSLTVTVRLLDQAGACKQTVHSSQIQGPLAPGYYRLSFDELRATASNATGTLTIAMDCYEGDDLIGWRNGCAVFG